MKLPQPYTLTVNGHCHMLVLVSIHSDDYPNRTTTFLIYDSCHLYPLLCDSALAWVSGQDCDGA